MIFGKFPQNGPKMDRKWTKKAPQITDVGIIVIGDYDDNIYVNKICTTSNISFHVVLLQLKSFNHNVCMIGKK